MDTALLAKSAVIRALRTFVQTFLAMLGAGVTDVVDVSTARSLVVAVAAAALAAAWRAFIDPTPIPSMVDPTPGDDPLAQKEGPSVGRHEPEPGW